MVKVRARDTDDLARLLKERFSKLPHLTATRTTIVLSTLKEANRIPLETLPWPTTSSPAEVQRRQIATVATGPPAYTPLSRTRCNPALQVPKTLSALPSPVPGQRFSAPADFTRSR
ncbi:MAG: Lrp/AsnC ligand binding domain-containing protein [Gemmatimonadaceae bacterium]